MVASSGHSPDAGAAPSRVGGVSPGEALAAAPVPTPVLFAAGPAIAAGATDAADAGRAVANVAANAVPGAVAALPHLALGLAARAGDWLSAAGAALSAASPVQGAAEGGGPSALIALPKGAMFLGLGSIVPQAADPSAARVWKVTAAVSLAAMLVGYGYCKIDEQRRREEREEQEDRRRRAGRWLVLAGDPGRYV
jgi:hypothetical protein